MWSGLLALYADRWKGGSTSVPDHAWGQDQRRDREEYGQWREQAEAARS
jgi:hypothetical protein